MAEGIVSAPEEFRGWLLKWTNYIKGYQKRWFVLSNGLLSYYRTQEEMTHTCRGTINLAGTFIDTLDSSNFVVTNGPSQVYHLRALNEVERQRWVTALELAKAKAVKTLDFEDESGGEDERGGSGYLGDHFLVGLKAKLKELTSAHDVVNKNSLQVLKIVSELEEGGVGGGTGEGGGGGKAPSSPRGKEKLGHFRAAATALVKAAQEFVEQAESTEKRWSRALQHELSARAQLQENMEKLAKEMHGLEAEARRSFPKEEIGPLSLPRQDSVEDRVAPDGGGVADNGTTEDGGDEEETFFDAVEMSNDELTKPKSVSFQPSDGDVGEGEGERGGGVQLRERVGEETKFGHTRNASGVSMNEAQLLLSSPEPDQLPSFSERTMSLPHGPVSSFFERWEPTVPKRRSTIPPKPSHRLNLWTIMKNCIGRDLSKIPMPVNFNEPTSILQRMVEDMLYVDILEKAASCDSSLEELAYLAIYSCSVYGTTAVSARVGKPFNPMLGETYECDRRAECGWRVFMEQVTHHPPMFAMHIEHKDFTMWEEYTVASKFRGKYLVCYPIGSTHIVFHKSGNHYTWNKVVTTIHNIIIGKLWIDQSGDAKITNHTIPGEEANIKFHAYSYFSRERQRRLTGSVTDESGKTHYVLKGHWDEAIRLAKVPDGDGKTDTLSEFEPAWTNVPPGPGHEAIYGFSEFTCSLNEPEEGVAPTDSRLRPDQRFMEQGNFDEANKIKQHLEEKQRSKRRKREALAAKAAEAAAAGDSEEAARLEKEATHVPLWFQKEYDPLTNTMMHVYKGGYWERKLGGGLGAEFPDVF